MDLLKRRIRNEGKIVGTDRITVDSFLNHQLDIALLMAIGKEIKRRFEPLGINKILTIDASCIAIAAITATYFDLVPAVIYEAAKPALEAEALQLYTTAHSHVGWVADLTEAEFIREMRIERAGIFTFSPEEGTLAARMEEQVDADIAQRRVELVVDLQSRVMDDFNEERLGSVVEVLCEGFDSNEGCYVGRTYADSVEIDGRVLFTAAGLIPAGEFVYVRVTGVCDGDLTGEIEE